MISGGFYVCAVTDSDLLDIKTEIAALEKREIQELQGEWRKLYRVEPPKRLSRDLLLRAIAHRIQERVDGGLGLTTKRRLDALAGRFRGGRARFCTWTLFRHPKNRPTFTKFGKVNWSNC